MRRNSCRLLLACALLLAGSALWAARPVRSVLLFPVESHWLSAPLAEAVTEAVAVALVEEGYSVIVARPASSSVKLAFSEGWLESPSLSQEELWEAREPLAIALAKEAIVRGALEETEAGVAVELTLAGVVTREEAEFSLTAPRERDIKRTAGEIAARVVGEFTPDLFAEAGLEEEARKRGARERYLVGQAALSEGMYREAVIEFEAALLGDQGEASYLVASSAARAALGDYAGAMSRMRRLATIVPDDAEVALQLGEAALLAGEPEQARAAFLAAAEELGENPRVVEGLALAARLLGEPERAAEYYEVLMAILPGLEGQSERLPLMLANSRETVRLAFMTPREVKRAVGQFYIKEGRVLEGVVALLAYYEEVQELRLEEREYRTLAAKLDEKMDDMARRVQGIFAAQAVGQLSRERGAEELDELHAASDMIARMAELMSVTEFIDLAHRFRVLSYNLLNQSNFEAKMYARTRDEDRQRRAELLRTAFRRSLSQAMELETNLERARLRE